MRAVRRPSALTPTLAFAAVLAVSAAACASDDGPGASSPDAGWSYADGGSVGLSDGGGAPSGDGGGSNISLGGGQDFGYFRKLLDEGMVPSTEDFDSGGFFHEHYLNLPAPTCGDRVCLHAMLGVMGSLVEARGMTTLQIGLNTPVTLDPGTRPPLTLAVVVDVSGSMAADDKIGFVRDGLATLIANLADTDEMALITYSDTATVLHPMAPLSTNRGALAATAAGLAAGGSTNFYDGLNLGYQEVAAHYDFARQNRVIMLSDGVPTIGETREAFIMAMSAAWNAEGLAITTIGLGVDFNAVLMRGLAEQGYGNHYFLENSAAIEEVFTEELAYFTVPVAYDVTIDVTAGPLYGFGRAYGTSFWEDTPTGGHISVPSVFLAHRVSDGDVTPGGGRRGGGSALLLDLSPVLPTPDPEATSADVAVIDISFRDPASDESVTRQIVVNYPYAPEYVALTGYFDSPDLAVIQKSFVMLNIYMAIELACRTFHLGDATTGLGALYRVQAAVLDYNDSVNGGLGDEDMTYDLALIQQLIDVLIANGAVPPDDPGIPPDPWPAD